jgi:hypothetical protein
MLRLLRRAVFADFAAQRLHDVLHERGREWFIKRKLALRTTGEFLAAMMLRY